MHIVRLWSDARWDGRQAVWMGASSGGRESSGRLADVVQDGVLSRHTGRGDTEQHSTAHYNKTQHNAMGSRTLRRVQWRAAMAWQRTQVSRRRLRRPARWWALGCWGVVGDGDDGAL